MTDSALLSQVVVFFSTEDPESSLDVARAVDAVVRVLVADGLFARRTGPDRLETSWRGLGTMEWCWLGDLVLGRALEAPDPTQWTHKHVVHGHMALADVGRAISRSVRVTAGVQTL